MTPSTTVPATSATPEERAGSMLRFSAGGYYRSRFISFGADVWGGGNNASPFSSDRTAPLQGTLTARFTPKFSGFINIRSDLNDNVDSNTGRPVVTATSYLEYNADQHDYVSETPSKSQQWSSPYAVFLEGITCVSDGFKALDLTALGIGHNELRVVVGPNGAGKATMCDVISGLLLPTTGKVFFAGEGIRGLTDTERAKRGSGRKFQIPNVFDSLTAWENMPLALPDPPPA